MQEPTFGVKQKVLLTADKQLRLVIFDDTFLEENWCVKSHLGILLLGELTINFNGTCLHFGPNDLINIPAGESHKHKAIIQAGKSVILLLFEEL